MPNHILVSGPVSWNSIVYLDHLPEPRPHMQFALDDFETKHLHPYLDAVLA